MAKKKSKKKATSYSPRKIGVKTVATSELRPNPHNPRILFDRQPMATLEKSIRKVGILVPLVVYKGRTHSRYTILDGQRRWTCAKSIGLPRVPVNEVAEPSVVENIVTMFQIHKLREDWELMPTALKLELLMEKLQERSETALSELTGLDRAVVTRCKKLLTYPSKYQEMMLDPDPDNRMKSDFFIELHTIRTDRLVNQYDWFRKDSFTKDMLRKYKNPKSDLKSVTDFRTMKQHVTKARKANKEYMLSTRLKKYAKDDSLTMDSLAIQSAETAAEKRKILSKVSALKVSLESIDVRDFYGEKDLWKALEEILKLIQKRLRQADRRPKA